MSGTVYFLLVMLIQTLQVVDYWVRVPGVKISSE